MLLKSDDPEFSIHIKKNPSNVLTSKVMRQGILSGWFPKGGVQEYALFFKDTGTDNSFSTEQKNYLDLTQYASTYFVFQSMTTFFNSALSLSETQKPFNHEIHIPMVQLRNMNTLYHLLNYFDITVSSENLLDNSIERMSLYNVVVKGTMPFNEFLMKTYLLFYLLHADLHASDIVWMEGMIAKVTKIISELKCEYFLRYWFKKNVLVKSTTFSAVEEELNSNCSDGELDIRFGDTQYQRKTFIDGQINFNQSLLEIGHGDGYYFLPYAKKLKSSNKVIIGVDPDVKLAQNIQHKINDRKLTNASIVPDIADVVLNEPHDILCTEVIEHMELPAAKTLVKTLLRRDFSKLVITTPNVEFNKFYKGLNGFRHDDHYFEFTREEFKEFINECVRDLMPLENYFIMVKYHNIGDKVDNISVTQAAVITKHSMQELETK